MSLNLDKTDLKDNVLIITNDDGSIQCIPRDGATEEELALFEEFRQAYPDGKVIEISLDDAKASKIQELSDICNNTIISGFYSDADGTNKLYDFELENQVNISTKAYQIQIAKLAGQSIESVSYYAKGETCHDYTVDQFLKLASDGESWKTTNIVKYKDKLKPMVLACTTVDEVNAINWSSTVS